MGRLFDPVCCFVMDRRRCFVGCVFFVVILLQIGDVSSQTVETTKAIDNSTTDSPIVCKDGVIIPLWRPQNNLSVWDKVARAIVYFAAMAFMFLGVSIMADRFMAAIEVITSKEKQITIRKPDGETAVVCVRIWNETVSNLTLMALGSSAPEIMLSIIEIVGNGFEAGDLGPSTIVGSAAFNLFVIISICVYCIPNDEVRRVKHLRVFFITATWSIFAYLWLYLIIAVFSYGIIEVWEGVLTFMFFPATVITAYIADRNIFFYKFMSKRYRANRHKTVVVSEGDMEMDKSNHVGDDVMFKGLDNEDSEIREFEKHRKEFIDILRDMRKKNPNVDMKTLEEMAEMEAMNRGPKSRAFYRIQATRKLTGGGNVIKKSKLDRKAALTDVKLDVADDNVMRIYFEPGHYTVMENIGTFSATVARSGDDIDNTVYVDYRTEDGSATAGSDYEYSEGTLVFNPGERQRQFHITIIDDDVFEEDEHFYVRLCNIRVGEDGAKRGIVAQIVNPSMATIMILDDDHCGLFSFEHKEESFSESVGEVNLKVCRSSGARGRVLLKYHTIDGTAKGAGKDYEEKSSELIFENDQTEAYIKLRIIDDEEYEKNKTFFVVLEEPTVVRSSISDDEYGETDERQDDYRLHDKDESEKTEEEKIADLGLPKLGELTKIQCNIRESMEFRSTVDKLLKKTNLSLVVGTSSWKEQFIEAVSVSAGDVEDDAEAEDKLPSCMDYVMHFLTIFWKLLFAFVPPTDYWGGWACFCVSILGIGMLTALIGDIASGFGCTIGLKDAVTAITFVALGTSIPDTFASKVAAAGDQYADSSIGNVTGSNAVNVFLGIGIAWTMAAVKHAFCDSQLLIQPGSLAFSVTIYIIFAVLAIGVMLLRRQPRIGGELGGPYKEKLITSIFLFSLWCLYILLSSLESYGHIKGF